MSFKIPAGGSFAYGMPAAPAQAPAAPAPVFFGAGSFAYRMPDAPAQAPAAPAPVFPAGGSFAYGMPGALPVPAQAPVAPAPIVGAMPAPPVTIKRDSCAEIGMELAERYRQVIENGWRKINATSALSPFNFRIN